MSATKTWELRDMSRDEILQRKRELSEEEFNLRMQTSVTTLINPKRLREIRKEIARINTILREDELGIRKIGVQNR